MKISIVAAGKIKEKYLRDGIAEFTKRLKPFTQIEFLEINEEKMKDNPSPAEKAAVLKAEGERLLKKVPAGSYLIVLDVVGKSISSEELSQKNRYTHFKWSQSYNIFNRRSFWFISRNSQSC